VKGLDLETPINSTMRFRRIKIDLETKFWSMGISKLTELSNYQENLALGWLDFELFSKIFDDKVKKLFNYP
jgi:hypothetical protein